MLQEFIGFLKYLLAGNFSFWIEYPLVDDVRVNCVCQIFILVFYKNTYEHSVLFLVS